MFLNDAGLRLKHEVDFLLGKEALIYPISLRSTGPFLPPQAVEDVSANNLTDFSQSRAAIRHTL